MFSHKRAHSPDGFEDNQRPGPPQGVFDRIGIHHGGHQFHHPHQQFGGHLHYNKRHRGENYQQPQNMEHKIARLGEIGSSNHDIGFLAKEIESDLISKKGQEEERIKQITAQICKCIVSFPTKVGTYATLIGLISVKHYNVACQIIQTLHASYPVYLESQKWQEAITIINLLSSLVNCKVIRPSALLSQFEFMLESTLEDNIPQARSDYYVYTVLSSLPFVAFELSQQEDIQENFEKMLATIETYLSHRSKTHLDHVRVWQSNDSTIQMDYLDSLWVQMRNFKANNWTETFLSRPYNDKEYKELMASSLIATNSPTYQIPAHSEKYRYPSPRIVFRVFEDDIVENQKSIPGSDKIERFCIENSIRNMIDETATDPKNCARSLSSMLRWDQLPVKHLLVESILGELFTLPQTRHDETLYHTLLFEFTKFFAPSKSLEEIKNNYDMILNEAIKVLYDNLNTMNVTCITRFVNWLSFHLNNTDFFYPWQNWADAQTMDIGSPKAIFVRDILDRCVRLSYRTKVETLVKDKLTKLMPPEVCIKFQPVFIDNPRAAELIDTVRKLISFKWGGVEICKNLNIRLDNLDLPEDFVVQDEKLADQLIKIDVFIAVLLDMAQRSLSHVSSAIGKYRNVLKALTNVPQGQSQLMQTIQSCLTNHPQLQVILADKLLKANLIESKEICNWVFSEAMKSNHVSPFPWEILNNTLSRSKQNLENLISKRARIIQEARKETTDAKESGSGTPDPNDGDGVDGNGVKEDNDDAEMKVEEADEARELKLKEDLDQLDNQIETAKTSLKSLLLQVFALFSTNLRDHITQCEGAQKSFMDFTYHWLVGRMQEVYYNYIDTIRPFLGEVVEILDRTPSIGGLIVPL